MQNKANFFNLKIDESENLLKFFASSHNVVYVWNKASGKNIFRVKEYLNSNNKTSFVLYSEGEEIDISLCFKKINYSFFFNDKTYFGEASLKPFCYPETIKDNNTDKDYLELFFLEDIYLLDSRFNQRILTFPNHQVYLYYDIIERISKYENVFSLNNATVEHNLKRYKLKTKNDILNKLSQIGADVDRLSNFRILDISRTGVAFLIDAIDSEYFTPETERIAYLSFDSIVFKFDVSKVVYNIDYLYAENAVRKKKIGINYNVNNDFSKFITKILKKYLKDEKLFEDFEKFMFNK